MKSSWTACCARQLTPRKSLPSSRLHPRLEAATFELQLAAIRFDLFPINFANGKQTFLFAPFHGCAKFLNEPRIQSGRGVFRIRHWFKLVFHRRTALRVKVLSLALELNTARTLRHARAALNKHLQLTTIGE